MNVLSVFPSFNLTQRCGPGRERRKQTELKMVLPSETQRGSTLKRISDLPPIIATIELSLLLNNDDVNVVRNSSPARYFLCREDIFLAFGQTPSADSLSVSQLTYYANELLFLCASHLPSTTSVLYPCYLGCQVFLSTN